MLFYSALAFALIVNTFLGRLLPRIESGMLFFHVLGFFGLIIPLVYLAPHRPASEVFGNFLNLGDFKTSGLSFFVGLVTAMDAFPGKLWTLNYLTVLLTIGQIGLDAADHIGKQTSKPTVVNVSLRLTNP